MNKGKLYCQKDFASSDTSFFDPEASSIILHHQNLAQCVDFVIHADGSRSTYSEFCLYGDFTTLFGEKKLKFADEKVARTYFRQLVDAVEYMHNKNFGHLDLKVDNLFLDEEFRLRVGDFDFCSQIEKE
jgi:serine/threonine protein kinase